MSVTTDSRGLDGRLDRYHRRRVLLLVLPYVFVSVVALFRVSGLAGVFGVWLHQGIWNQRNWYPFSWSRFPVIYLSGVGELLDGSQLSWSWQSWMGWVEAGLALGLVAALLVSVRVVVTAAGAELVHFRRWSWRHAMCLALPMALLSYGLILYPFVLVLLTMENLGWFYPPAWRWIEYVFVFPGACVFLLWVMWALIARALRMPDDPYRSVCRFVEVLLITAGVLCVCSFSTWWEEYNRYAWRGDFRQPPFLAFPVLAAMHWLLGCLLMLVRRWPAQKQRSAGQLCRSCGYDLRGTLAAGRVQCPECGAAFT